MELVLTPMDTHTPKEIFRLSYGLHSLMDGNYMVGATQRNWVLVDYVDWYMSDIRDGDVIRMNGRTYECQIENPF